MQRLFVVALGVNIALIVAGIAVVPAALSSPQGLGTLLADVAMQIALAALALAGPFSFRQMRASIGISSALGLVFAALYLGIILREFGGVNDSINILAIFGLVAAGAGGAASYQARRWRPGVPAGIWALVIGTALWSAGALLINYLSWGSQRQYVFWLNDGAIGDFRRSGSHDLNTFLLQDLQGAVFFHPLLGTVVGAIGGLAGGGVARGGIALHRWAVQRARSQN